MEIARATRIGVRGWLSHGRAAEKESGQSLGGLANRPTALQGKEDFARGLKNKGAASERDSPRSTAAVVPTDRRAPHVHPSDPATRLDATHVAQQNTATMGGAD
jgi:hypothetical protein